ncbi:MAG: PD40 domain-containing protein [Bradymonadales bacterium]|nr:PD40 domain-containing protein [Bradymonadales bacterium]
MALSPLADVFGFCLVPVMALLSWWPIDLNEAVRTGEAAEMSPIEPMRLADQPEPGGPGVIAAGTQGSLVLSFPLHGNLATIAWSPDGRRLVANAAYRGRPLSEIERHRASLGLWVYERDEGRIRHLLDEQRYHPAWIGNETLASACASSEECAPGLTLTDLDGTSRQIVAGDILFTLAVDESRLLFYRPDSGWNRLDIRTGLAEPVEAAPGPVQPPDGLFVDQCVQQVGDLRLFTDAATGLWFQVGEQAPVQLDSTPPYWTTPHLGSDPADYQSAMEPCLSPDGRQAAYIAYREGLSGGGESEALFLFLRIHELPAQREDAIPDP